MSAWIQRSFFFGAAGWPLQEWRAPLILDLSLLTMHPFIGFPQFKAISPHTFLCSNHFVSRHCAHLVYHNCAYKCWFSPLLQAILTVFLPSGTWCPSGCLSHGIPIGGVAARHRLARGLSGTVLRYRIRFEQGFPWALGGALPGLYCNRGQGFRVRATSRDC